MKGNERETKNTINKRDTKGVRMITGIKGHKEVKGKSRQGTARAAVRTSGVARISVSGAAPV